MAAVDVWCAPLDLDDADWSALERTLDAAELAHARRIIDPLQRRRWVADHGWRRTLLGRLLEQPPDRIGFTLNPHGRPGVSGSELSFSASRGDGLAVYATSWDATVGVDIEPLRPVADLEAFARRFFSARERAALAALAPGEREAACFACWTRKEAFVKAVGTGLVFPLTEAEVWSGDDRAVRHDGCEIRSLVLGEGLAGALAIAGCTEDTVCHIDVKAITDGRLA